MIDTSLLKELIKDPETASDLNFSVVSEILKESQSILGKEDLLINLNPKDNEEVYVIGDIHGSLECLIQLYNIIKTNEPEYVVFLGDIVDRGQFQLECLLFILSLKLLKPKTYYLLRGNHETLQMNKYYGFHEIFMQKFARSDRFSKILSLYRNIPICAVINDASLCLHGGIPEDFRFLDKLKETALKKVDQTIPESVEDGIYQVMWNDPKEGLHGFGESFRGPGIKFFGQDVFEDFMKENGLKYLIRSHECFPEGYKWFFNKRLLSIFSAENYRGESMPNPASFAIIKNEQVIGKNVL